jgi:ABC-type bacteriocin/lantibiotic exporter with double-glycine peptidase domain
MKKISIAFILLFFSCAPSVNKIKSELAQNPLQGKYLQVKFIPQKELYCGPASLAMLLNYYGCELTQDEIAERYFIAELGGMLNLDLIVAAKELGFEVEHGKGDWESLTRKIDSGDPVIVFWNYSIEPVPLRHFALAVGYFQSNDKEWLILHSGEKPDRIMSRAQFERLWAQEGNWMMSVKPSEQICKWRFEKENLQR